METFLLSVFNAAFFSDISAADMSENQESQTAVLFRHIENYFLIVPTTGYRICMVLQELHTGTCGKTRTLCQVCMFMLIHKKNMILRTIAVQIKHT